jgi:hypothetical protein
VLSHWGTLHAPSSFSPQPTVPPPVRAAQAWPREIATVSNLPVGGGPRRKVPMQATELRTQCCVVACRTIDLVERADPRERVFRIRLIRFGLFEAAIHT